MKNCISCSASLPDESQYCNVCGKSQVTGGAYKIAEGVSAVKRGLERAGMGFILGIAVAVSFCVTIFARIWVLSSPYLYEGHRMDQGKALGFYADPYHYFGIAEPGIVIIIPVIIIIIVVLSGISPRFLCLVMALTPGSIMGAIICWAVGLWFRNMLPGQILYFIILPLITFPLFIYLLVKNQLIVQKPGRGGYVNVIKTELVDTAREIKRFGRR